jgi:hypothetical protein
MCLPSALAHRLHVSHEAASCHQRRYKILRWKAQVLEALLTFWRTVNISQPPEEGATEVMSHDCGVTATQDDIIVYTWGVTWLLDCHVTSGLSRDFWAVTWLLDCHVTSGLPRDLWAVTWLVTSGLSRDFCAVAWLLGCHVTSGLSRDFWAVFDSYCFQATYFLTFFCPLFIYSLFYFVFIYYRNEYQEYFLGGKGGRCVGLTTLPPSCADCL